MRVTTTAFNAAIAQTVTAVGFLVEINFGASPTSLLRWCDLGLQSFGGHSWSAMDMRVQGFGVGTDGFGAQPLTLSVQNLDSAVVALLLANLGLETSARFWQIARDVGSPGDAPQLADMVCEGAEIGLDAVTMRFIPRAGRYLFAPRKRCDASFGLANASVPGTTISWGGEIITIGE